MYISKYGLYDENISLEKLIKNQNILINNYTSNPTLFRSIIDYLDLIVFLPIHKSLQKKLNGNGLFLTEGINDKQLVKNYPAFRNYTKYYDGIINTMLRNNINFHMMNDQLKQIFKGLNSTVRRRYHLYRGVNFDITKYTKNNTITDKAFMSKTYLPDVASKFTSNYCCIICFIYKYASPLLDISSISYFPNEAEVLTFPGEIYNIFSKKLCYVLGDIITIYFAEITGNIYDNSYDRLLDMTSYVQIYDEYVYKIREILERHINYEDENASYFNGFVYLENCEGIFIFSQSKIRTQGDLMKPDLAKLDYYLDVGLILKTFITSDLFEFGEINIGKLPYGVYKLKVNYGNILIDDDINLDINLINENSLYLINYDKFELIDPNGKSFTGVKNIIMKI